MHDTCSGWVPAEVCASWPLLQLNAVHTYVAVILFFASPFSLLSSIPRCQHTQLIDDKKALSDKCEKLLSQMKEMEEKYAMKLKTLTER